MRWSEATEWQWYAVCSVAEEEGPDTQHRHITQENQMLFYFILNHQINTIFTVGTRDQHPYLQDALLTVNLLLFDV